MQSNGRNAGGRSKSIGSSIIRSEEGDVSISVEEDLEREYGPNFYRSICSTTRVTKVDYCQSLLSRDVPGVPRSAGSSMPRSNEDANETRLPRGWGLINHDFLVVHVQGTDRAHGNQYSFRIVAEKIGQSPEGDPAGIYIGVLSENDFLHLHRNACYSYDCFSTLIPLDVLIKALWKDLDPNYHFFRNNCWDYAKAACKKVLLTLSQQSGLSPQRTKHLQDRAQGVSGDVKLRAAKEASGTGAMVVLSGVAIVGLVVSTLKLLRSLADRQDDGQIRETQDEDRDNEPGSKTQRRGWWTLSS